MGSDAYAKMRSVALALAVMGLGAVAARAAELKDPVAHREYKRMATWIVQLEHADARKRAHAAFVLGNIGSREGIGPMVSRLMVEPKGNSRVILALCYALGQLKAKSAYLLELGSLRHGDAGVRNHAAWALGEIGFASCAPELIRLLADGDQMVRRRAAESLRKLSGKSFGYDPKGGAAERAASAAKWAAWWRREGKTILAKEADELGRLFGPGKAVTGTLRTGGDR